MFFNGKGKTLLQYLKKPLILFLLVLYSCSTTPDSDYDNSIPIIDFFEGNVRDNWISGLELIKNEVNEDYIILLFRLYLDIKYKSIQKELIPLIRLYVKNSSPDYEQVLKLLKTPADALSLSELIKGFGHDEIIKYSNIVFESELDQRDALLTNLGSFILEYTHVLELFDTGNKKIKSRLLYSTGFMKSNEINNWLVERLYDTDDELSSAAVFSLSRHGNAGYSLLAENLNSLSDRLILISIDLLIHNKVDEVYAYFPDLLITKNDLVAKKILDGYKNLGKKGFDYIIDSLKVSHIDYRIQLLEILEGIENIDYFNKIYFLLENPELQSYIIDLYFRNGAYYLIQNLLTSSKYDLQDEIILYAIVNSSNLIFKNKILSNFSLNYFLENFDFERVKLYFEMIGFDNNYVDDYESVLHMYEGLNYMGSIEGQNGDVDFISKYFELEQSILIAESELSIFYQGMERWLESGDIADLDRSLSIKETHNPGSVSIQDKKDEFIKSLSPIDRDTILNYENTKNSIQGYYRNLTYRLKSFGYKIVSDKDYLFLLD